MAVGQGGSSRSGPGSRFAPRLDLDLQMRSGPPASWTWTGPVRFGPGSDPVQAVLTRTLDSVEATTNPTKAHSSQRRPTQVNAGPQQPTKANAGPRRLGMSVFLMYILFFIF